MNGNLEAKIQKEIRRRAIERADVLRQERLDLEKTQYTLDALQEVTGLDRSELQSIAASVKLSLRGTHDDFFSIKRQLLITFGVSGFVLILCVLMTLI